MIKEEELVSVIIPVFNSEKFLSEAIISVIEQTYKNLEILISDDCSEDNSRKIIESFSDESRIKVFNNHQNIGAGNTRNKLIKEASGKYVCFLDSDDLIEKDKIEKQVSAFQTDEELGLCGTFCQIIDINLSPIKIEKKNILYDDIKENIILKNQFVGASIMVKKVILEEMGGYRDFFSQLCNEDYDLTARIVDKYKAINIPEPLYLYRMNSNSTSQNSWKEPYKLHSCDLVSLFIIQRRERGSDWLEEKNYSAIDQFIEEKHKPYITDPSLIYRELAAAYNDYNAPWKGVKSSLIGICKKPNKLLNYRAFGYSLKKALRLV